MFTIEIYYQTGNSFNTCDETEHISAVWEDRELARNALQCIKEHYEIFSKLDGYGITPLEREKLNDFAKTKSWYCESYPSYSIKVDLDAGETLEINAFWMGYFEKLHKATIVSVESDLDSYTP